MQIRTALSVQISGDKTPGRRHKAKRKKSESDRPSIGYVHEVGDGVGYHPGKEGDRKGWFEEPRRRRGRQLEDVD